jgi:hypothetical protein
MTFSCGNVRVEPCCADSWWKTLSQLHWGAQRERKVSQGSSSFVRGSKRARAGRIDFRRNGKNLSLDASEEGNSARSALGKQKSDPETLLETNALSFCGDTFEHHRSFWI